MYIETGGVALNYMYKNQSFLYTSYALIQKMTTSTIRDSCIEFFQKEEIKRCVKEIIRPIVQIIYNEIYPYMWFICIYNVFLIFLTLANLILLFWIRNVLVHIHYHPVTETT